MTLLRLWSWAQRHRGNASCHNENAYDDFESEFLSKEPKAKESWEHYLWAKTCEHYSRVNLSLIAELRDQKCEPYYEEKSCSSDNQMEKVFSYEYLAKNKLVIFVETLVL